MDIIERAIRKIPFIGAVWNWLEKLVSKIIEGIFSRMPGLPIPSIAIGLGPLGDALSDVRDALDFLSSFSTSFDSLLDFEKLKVHSLLAGRLHVTAAQAHLFISSTCAGI